ncbi:MAG TPA: isocitrate lyase/phosphoenolpyruvate mutase family protein [Anaerolineales bacterium]|nr:isocitrate lyase/phosphoenolpyruvate mutase family protein [Anaerolineales bacterium]
MQRKKAERFLELHHGERILVLPNAWDVASARVFERAGFNAIATTSAGVANANGYPDGERMSRAEMLEAIRRIAQMTALPVTADMEEGFGAAPQQVAETARLTLETGAVGINLEDGTRDEAHPLTEIPLQAEKIKAARQAADAYNVPLVINARVDVYEKAGDDHKDFLAEAIRRGNAYREAGADCIFMISVDNRETIAQLAREIAAPLNVLARRGSPTIAELQQLGVARVTFGSIPMRAAMTLTKRIAEEIVQHGTYGFAEDILTYGEANAYFEK